MITLYNKDELDVFFKTMASIFLFSLEHGIVGIRDYAVSIKNEHIRAAIELGIDSIQAGINPIIIQKIIETHNLLALKTLNDAEDADTLLFQLKLVEIIIPYIQGANIEEFLDLIYQVPSSKVQDSTVERIKTFIPAVKAAEATAAARPAKAMQPPFACPYSAMMTPCACPYRAMRPSCSGQLSSV